MAIIPTTNKKAARVIFIFIFVINYGLEHFGSLKMMVTWPWPINIVMSI